MWVGLRCPKTVGLRKRHAPNLMSWLGGTFGVGVQAPVVSVAVNVLKATRPSAIPNSTATVCGMVRERFMGLGVLCGRAHNPCDHACSAGPSTDTSSVALFRSMQWGVYIGSLTWVTYTPLPLSSLYAMSQIACDQHHIAVRGCPETGSEHNSELARTCRLRL